MIGRSNPLQAISEQPKYEYDFASGKFVPATPAKRLSGFALYADILGQVAASLREGGRLVAAWARHEWSKA